MYQVQAWLLAMNRKLLQSRSSLSVSVITTRDAGHVPVFWNRMV